MTGTGSLLQRNQPGGGALVELHSQGEVEARVRYDPGLDPLSLAFVVPDWLQDMPTPWNLVSYFEECLSSCYVDGLRRCLVNGHTAELRPAKKLLDKYGVEDAARVVKYWAEQVSRKMTLHRVVDRAQEILNLCQRSTLRPLEEA